MKIRRYSPCYLLLLAFVVASSAFLAFAAFYSSIREEEYTGLGLPVLNINTYGKKINSKENYRDAVYSLDAGDFHWEGSCKIRGRGNSTWKTIDTSKKPYLLKLDQEESLLGLGKARRWVLKASATDKTFLRDEYAFYLAQKIWNRFGWTPSQKFVTLVLNGKYAGLYGIQEKIEIGPERVNITPSEGSILFKIDEQLNEQFNFTSEHGAPFSIVDTDGVEYSGDDFSAIKDFVNEREKYIFGEQEDGESWTRYFDLDSLVDWYLVNEFTKNHDSRFQGSCFLVYDAKRDKFFMGPVWDFDIAAGNTDASSCSESEGYITAQAFWYEWLLQDEVFMAALKSRWKETRGQIEASINNIQDWADDLHDAAVLNDRVWKSFGHRQWPNPSGWRSRKCYQDEIDYMIAYLHDRFLWLDSQWN